MGTGWAEHDQHFVPFMSLLPGSCLVLDCTAYPVLHNYALCIVKYTPPSKLRFWIHGTILSLLCNWTDFVHTVAYVTLGLSKVSEDAKAAFSHAKYSAKHPTNHTFQPPMPVHVIRYSKPQGFVNTHYATDHN